LLWAWKPTCASSCEFVYEWRTTDVDASGTRAPAESDDIDALASGVGHYPGLHRKSRRLDHVAQHQEADGLEASSAGGAEVLARDVRLGQCWRPARSTCRLRRRA